MTFGWTDGGDCKELKNDILNTYIICVISTKSSYGPRHEKTCLQCLQTKKAQTSLCICPD